MSETKTTKTNNPRVSGVVRMLEWEKGTHGTQWKSVIHSDQQKDQPLMQIYYIVRKLFNGEPYITNWCTQAPWSSYFIGEYKTPDQAKEAAQAHYNGLIMSGIDYDCLKDEYLPTPTTEEMVKYLNCKGWKEVDYSKTGWTNNKIIVFEREGETWDNGSPLYLVMAKNDSYTDSKDKIVTLIHILEAIEDRTYQEIYDEILTGMIQAEKGGGEA